MRNPDLDDIRTIDLLRMIRAYLPYVNAGEEPVLNAVLCNANNIMDFVNEAIEREQNKRPGTFDSRGDLVSTEN